MRGLLEQLLLLLVEVGRDPNMDIELADAPDASRIGWINRIFVPLAEAYLQLAVDGIEDEELSHTDPDIVDPAALDHFRDGKAMAA